jgi:hypothetical protein
MSPGPGRPACSEQLPDSPAPMPISARMFRNVPLAMSRPRVDRDDHRPAIGVAHHVVASADSRDRESCPLKRPDHLRPRNCRESVRHQATSRVSVISSGGPTSTSSASSAPRRSATAASADGPSPTAPTPGRSCAEAHQTPSSSRSTTYGTWTIRVTTSILPYPDSGTADALAAIGQHPGNRRIRPDTYLSDTRPAAVTEAAPVAFPGLSRSRQLIGPRLAADGSASKQAGPVAPSLDRSPSHGRRPLQGSVPR